MSAWPLHVLPVAVAVVAVFVEQEKELGGLAGSLWPKRLTALAAAVLHGVLHEGCGTCVLLPDVAALSWQLYMHQIGDSKLSQHGRQP